MQPKIKILDAHEAIKIAAGEVIERPAHLIKELIENSIDAGATTITLYVQAAGKDLIKIVDDGCGMSPEDAKLCFAHHATSKITTVLDLDSINTYGFRGEALSSIAAVSTVELITKTTEQKVATHIKIEHGNFIFEQIAAHPTGTTFTISNLFANIPARRKFLKSDDTEWNSILAIFQAFCLRYLHINFKLFHNDHMAYHSPATTNLTVRCAQLWNNNLHDQLLTVTTTTEKEITVSGAISTSHYYRFNRGQIFTFVNNRWVKNHELTKGILQGYDGVLPHQKYPAAFVFIDIDPKLIDINIHPKKEEVKFLNPSIVQRIVATAIKETLNSAVNQKLTVHHSPQINTQPSDTDQAALHNFHATTTKLFADDIDAVAQKKEQPQTFAQPAPQPMWTTYKNISPNLPPIKTVAPTSEAPTRLFREKSYSIIGQLKKTYILIEQEDELILIDQHAAHERIIYERLLLQPSSPSVTLMFPHIIKLSPSLTAQLPSYQHMLQQHGIIIEPFSDHELILQATPVGMQAGAAEEIVRMISDKLEQDSANFHTHINEKIICEKACKSACKAGDTLDIQQIQALVKELMTVNNRFSCPHGRPTMWNITFKEIEKHFKRDYVGSKNSTTTLL